MEKNFSQLNCYVDQMELTEEIKEKLIDKVNVYSDNRIEICWNFDSGFFDLETMHKCGWHTDLCRNQKNKNFFSPYLTEEQAVSKWESNQCCPDIQLLPQLADIFEISIDELFGRKAGSKNQNGNENNDKTDNVIKKECVIIPLKTFLIIIYTSYFQRR